jgi:tRNA nucleotidyltransferase (CCA-adding enzyme)
MIERLTWISVAGDQLSGDVRPSHAARLLADSMTEFCWPRAAATSATTRDSIAEYARRWRYVHPFIDGHTLRARGLSPGPSFRRILEALRTARLDGVIHTQEEEEQMLSSLLAEENS